ncbi:unnamed protein product [Hymenolepis diminuta]|uniref:Uncharacterized protein n=1 Tax=Hymenolepis diminuta TaxID=6216 RepID=A0A564Y272_HYMDI|nr:unnamed protein product [Hymenolepis diminuta]
MRTLKVIKLQYPCTTQSPIRGFLSSVTTSVGASDYLQIENIPSCSSPALPESSQNGGGLQFSEKVATPGKLVTMTLNLLHGHADGDSIYGTCILSTIKVTIKNFDIAAM